MRRVAAIPRVNLGLADVTPVIHSLDHVAFRHPYHTLHFLTSIAYTLKEIMFEQRFRVATGSKLFLNWHRASNL